MCCIPWVVPSHVTGQILGISCEAACLSGCLTCCVSPCWAGYAHSTLREKYGLKGSAGMDCVLGCVAMPCIICQEAHELGKRSGFTVPLTRVGVETPVVKPPVPIAGMQH